MVRQPLAATETMDKFDILILADGGGVAGQAGAVRLGISRALVEFNAELRPRLKKLGFLTRDPRTARAQEVRPKGRSQAVPVLQTITFSAKAGGSLSPAFALYEAAFRSVPQAQISLWNAPDGTPGKRKPGVIPINQLRR